MHVGCNLRWNRIRIHKVAWCEYQYRRVSSRSWTCPFETRDAAETYALSLDRPDTDYCDTCCREL